MFRSLLLTLLFTFSASVYAGDFNYTYLSASYSAMDLDDTSADGDVIGIGGSFAVSDNYHVFANYGAGDIDDSAIDFDIDSWSIGIGYNRSLSESIDLVAGISYEYVDVSAQGFSSVDDSGYGLGLGLRMAVNEELEVNAGIALVDFGDLGDNTAFAVGALYNFTDNLSLGLQASFDEDVSTYGIHGRWYFVNSTLNSQQTR
ncbi:MAG: porin family protein [Pseudomonadales bacterium]|nr:porin family protein [Pseudomonadales bacterium]